MDKINNTTSGNQDIIYAILEKLRDRFFNYSNSNEDYLFLFDIAGELADTLGNDLILTESTFSNGTYYFFFKRTDTTEKNDQTLQTKIFDVLTTFRESALPDKEVHIFSLHSQNLFIGSIN